MPITTWIHSYCEVESMSSVKDKTLNDLFQEVRQATNNRFLLSETEYQDRGWFGKRNRRTAYTLYIHIMHDEYQVINFATAQTEGSINTAAPRETIMNYFYGVLTGIQHEAHKKANP
ncbi:MAG: hypothetical protein ACTHMC_01445 [Pseudobacter sp.]|uniref:hypothetical protein n=1 Tax=Pseudobacter sp. TaxID=2045420 RepID=UPI003F7E873C